MPAYEEALQQLARAALPGFLAERKRLAGELRSGGDKAAATKLEQRRKPAASVWAVNQLYWHARAAFDEMLATAASLRAGDLRANRAYREALTALNKRAAKILQDAGLAASDVTLRRVATTLAAIAATGGFDPEPPGALAADLDPPGFEAAGVPLSATREARASPTVGRGSPRGGAHAEPARHAADSRDADERRAADERDRRREERERARAEQAESKRRAQELARREVERSRLRQELRQATKELSTRESELAAIERRRQTAQQAADDARGHARDLERRLAELDGNAQEG